MSGGQGLVNAMRQPPLVGLGHPFNLALLRESPPAVVFWW